MKILSNIPESAKNCGSFSVVILIKLSWSLSPNLLSLPVKGIPANEGSNVSFTYSKIGLN